MTAIRACLVAAALVVGATTSGHAEFQISAFGGYSTAHDSDVTIKGASPISATVSWNGVSFEMPPYWGARATLWHRFHNVGELGIGVEYTHDKVRAKTDPVGYTSFEFTDGLNYFMLNVMKRWAVAERASIYGGLGGGISMPHVEVTPPAGAATFEYQVTGPAVQALVGLDFAINQWLSLFGEYKLTHSWNEADLDQGATLDVDVLSHQFLVGASIKFGAPPPPPSP